MAANGRPPLQLRLWVGNEAQPNGPLGYGPSSADIESGRIISGNAQASVLQILTRAVPQMSFGRSMATSMYMNCSTGTIREWIRSGTSVAG